MQVPDISELRVEDHPNAPSTNGTTNLGAAPDGYRLTDSGNAARLIAQGGDRVRYVHAWGKWIIYSRGRWTVDHNDALITEQAKDVPKSLLRLVPTLSGGERDTVFKWAIRSESAATLGALTRLARGIGGVLVDHEQLDVDPSILNVRNGTVDLRTGRLRPHDPNDLCTLMAPVAYDPDAMAPTWQACLERWQPDPDILGYLQRSAGAATTGHPTETLDVHHGGGANGKSRFFGAICHTLGDYACVPDKSLFVVTKHEQHPTVKAKLFRRRLAVVSETRQTDRLSEAQVKELTGGDRINARRMREDEWEFDPTHTLALFCNHRPKVNGRDEGIWRRIRLVPWTITIPEDQRDQHLASKLHREAPGILRWLVEGAQLFYERGLDPPGAVRSATGNYRSGEDDLKVFLDECCLLGDGLTARAIDLVKAWRAWCKDRRVPPGRNQDFSDRMVAAGIDYVENHNRVTWLGLDLLSEDSS